MDFKAAYSHLFLNTLSTRRESIIRNYQQSEYLFRNRKNESVLCIYYVKKKLTAFALSYIHSLQAITIAVYYTYFRKSLIHVEHKSSPFIIERKAHTHTQLTQSRRIHTYIIHFSFCIRYTRIVYTVHVATKRLTSAKKAGNKSSRSHKEWK